MEDEYAELRYLTRTRLGLIWDMVMAGAELEGEEATFAEILKQHPEYSDIWERAAVLDPHEEVLRDGANPFAHIAIHQVIANQIANRNPPQTAETLEALMQAGYTRHEAIHAIGAILAQEIFEILRDERPFDETGYIQALCDLAETSTRPRKQSRSSRKKRR
jgi:alkylhydroperoxidase/carboxymuconolactone decarboxylase family protein YurZ